MNSDPWSIQPFIGPLVVIIGLIVLHGFFSAAEMAMISINPNRMMEESLDGSKKAKRILRILDNADEFLTTIQVGISLSALFTSGMSAIVMLRLFDSFENPILSSQVFSLTVSAIVLTYLLLSFGEKLPKAIAKQNPDEIAMKLSGMVLGLRYLSVPIVWLVNVTVRGMKHLLPIDFTANDETITRDEFRSFIEHSHQHEVIDIDEFSMLKGVLSLDNKIAREVMVPRTDAFMLDYDDPNEENIEAMLETPHSRVPLYFEDKDNILGIVHVKNLLQASKHKPLYSIDLKEISNRPLFVPETIFIDDLIFQMKKTQNQMAILNDEYGGVVGIVTLEDLLEEIVGEIDDEYDESNNLIEQIDDFIYSVDGATPLDKFNDYFDMSIDSEDVDTIAGYFITEFGSIPGESEKAYIRVDDLCLTVDKMEGSRISTLIVKKHQEENTEETTENEQE
ncbi:putative hemolysin [Alkalibacterium subtropicum]|uniref:Putative hemolysin n=1 Tax=Alkalibacterium subtropicum TaxID=753702 RepID=A0A1I1HM53_9LACT|nr:hemolysin family protein [Alkalibacterium subtropicum]SFC25209.1 putative hemolysin [Alkalibacterium subtropicum]